ncbi:hypothetical protein F4779DRAFT_624249 [Xylariaceae sp. FL0662B]|nr:hypothetical protein F4779DRAFT_624249 [Xylariaceae sp. FL0662B]
MENYNLFQEIYCFSVASGAVSKREGSDESLEEAMEQALNETLPCLPGSWSISWGPRVFKEQNPDSFSGGPDNVWFAAVDETRKVCVTAIAGTAYHSRADIIQDLAIFKVVDFNAWVEQWSSDDIPKPQTSDPDENNSSTVAYCSEGTCIGTWNVLSNSSRRAGEGTRIDQYLSSLDTSYTIVVTGHSLGGALAPIVALGLRAADMIGTHDVKVVASAGVSPGNDKLALDYAASFPRTPEPADDYQVYNTDYYNEFDIVPQAWSISKNDDRNLHNILKILRFIPGLELFAGALLLIAEFVSQQSKIRYTPLPGQKFTGPQPEEITSLAELRKTTSMEHTDAYWAEIGITEFVNLFNRRLRTGN